MHALALEEGRELSDRFNWQVLTKEATFTTVAEEKQLISGETLPVGGSG